MHQKNIQSAMNRLLKIIATLRSPGGCPWDAKQTPESLKPFIIEEAYEVIEAIDIGDALPIREELGDLLLQVFLQARIFEERGLFNMVDVANSIADKLERRHPHVFGAAQTTTHSNLAQQWESIKREEKSRQGKTTATLGDLPPQLPALMKAKKVIEKASHAGFAWPNISEALAKVHEELAECEEAFKEADHQAKENELGDLLFAVVNLGQFMNIDAESALEQTIKRFTSRFNRMEQALKIVDRKLDSTSLEELLALWSEAKHQERLPLQDISNTLPQ